MNFNKQFLIITSLLTSINYNLLASPTGEELFIQKCTSCHSINMPKTKAGLKAPPAVGVMFHLNQRIDEEEALRKHIVSYTMNPTIDTAICKSVRKFGLMPSQKDNVTKEELEIIAGWLVEDIFISKSKYYKQRKEMFAN